jgi:alpha-mannosidase/mannosylglycerate hydrolase
VRPVGSLRTGPTAAENEHLAIAIDSNGTLTLTDKSSGQTFTDLLLWQDRSEIGDGWFHGHTLNDEQILSSASRAQVALMHEGPELVTFRVGVTLDIPTRYDGHAETRSQQRRPLEIVSSVTLRRGAKVVEIETTLNNIAQDHRLQLLLPTDATNARTFFAHHPYDFVERSIALDAETYDWQEMEIAEKPFLHAQAVGDDTRGLAFISGGGLHEGGVMDDQRRTMQVTLLRSFRKTIATGGEHDGLEQGELRLCYALMPYAGALLRAEIMHVVARLQTRVLTRQTGARPSGFPALAGDTPRHGLLEVDGELVVSAIKARESGGGFIVRLWNPTDGTQTSTLRVDMPFSSVRVLKLNEEVDASLALPNVEGNKVSVQAGPHRIVTLGIEVLTP